MDDQDFDNDRLIIIENEDESRVFSTVTNKNK